MASKGQKLRKYNSAIKEKILKEYWSGICSTQLSKKYGVPEKTIRTWSFNVKHGKTGNRCGRPRIKGLTLEDYKELSRLEALVS